MKFLFIFEGGKLCEARVMSRTYKARTVDINEERTLKENVIVTPSGHNFHLPFNFPLELITQQDHNSLHARFFEIVSVLSLVGLSPVYWGYLDYLSPVFCDIRRGIDKTQEVWGRFDIGTRKYV